MAHLSFKDQHKVNEELKTKLNLTTENLIVSEKKKIAAQKAASHNKLCKTNLLHKFKDLKEGQANDHQCELNRLNNAVEELSDENETLREQLAQNIGTRNKDGSFNNSIRLCVIELAGLEVACEKVSPVISAVSNHIFGRQFNKSDLPSSTTVQTVVDEGHYLAKSYVSDQLVNSPGWGLHCDGTSRRKQKILDTSVTLESGDVMSLGFTRVSKETAVEIHNVTTEHLKELATLYEDSNSDQKDYVKETLKKLAFTMSDRAANENITTQSVASPRTPHLSMITILTFTFDL